MTPKTDLFDLIKSLDKGEKTYFKKFSRIHSAAGASRYLRLFDAINAQTNYNEAKLIRKFKGKIFTNQFSVAKNYLFNTILKSLRSFHKDRYSEVRDQLQNAEIFYEKGFFKQSHQAILKAKKTAKKYELYWSMPELFRMEEKISVDLNDMDYFQSILRERSAALSIQENTQAYREINFKIILLYRKYGKAREKMHLEEMKKICGSKLLQNESLALSVEAKCIFHRIWSIYAYSAGNRSAVSAHLEKIIDIYHNNPEMISINFNSYIIYFDNLILNSLDRKNYEQAEEFLLVMKNAIRFANTQIQKTKFYGQFNYLSLVYFNETGKFSKAIAIIPAIANDLEKQGRNLSESKKALILINIAHAWFGAGQYDKCIRWINRIRNEIDFIAHPDIEKFCNIFYLIANFEAGKNELLPYLIKSAYRTLNKKEQLYKFETILLGFLRNDLAKINTKNELKAIFQKTRIKLLPLLNDPYEKHIFTYFDFISWLETRIEKKSFEEIVREKASPK